MATREILCPDCGEKFTIERGNGGKGGRWPTYCPDCKSVRQRAANREKQYRWRAANPEKWAANQARDNARRLADPEHRRAKREAEIQRQYGISPGDYAQMLDAQGGTCAICQRPPLGRGNGRARAGRPAVLHVDHDHETSRVRGLLCSNCNTILGLANEDSTVLKRAIEYLKKE